MGTRNLTCIKKNGIYVLAKYCQWDGYYEGQGRVITDFLRTPGNIERLRYRADDLRFISMEELRDRWVEVGAKLDDGWVSWDVSQEFRRRWPELHRDMGGEVLRRICETEGEFKTADDLAFAADGLFCEFAYVIDFDDNTFSWYQGFHREPLADTERFAFLNDKAENGYFPVKEMGRVPLEIDKIPDWSETVPCYDEETYEEAEG